MFTKTDLVRDIERTIIPAYSDFTQGSGSTDADYNTCMQRHFDALWVKYGPSILRGALAASAGEAAQASYSLDTDPQGIRARAAEAITGALAFGAQGNNPPPTGHWLAPFWEMARAERSVPAAPQVAAAPDFETWYRMHTKNRDFRRPGDEWLALAGDKEDYREAFSDGAAWEASKHRTSAPQVAAATVPLPINDARHLLTWMDEKFGNPDGDDWFDTDAASIADGLEGAFARFKRANAGLAAAPEVAAPWIPVEERLPEIGQWAILLVDHQEGGFWHQKYCGDGMEVACARLRSIDQEGYACWTRWQMASGMPLGEVEYVTHWMPLPAPPTDRAAQAACTGGRE